MISLLQFTGNFPEKSVCVKGAVHKKCVCVCVCVCVFVCVFVCVYEGVEKTFVRFYRFFIFILHVQKFSFSFRCLRAKLCDKG